MTLVPIRNPKRLLIFGDRWWRDATMIYILLHALEMTGHAPEVVIEGEAQGADALARHAAEDLGIPVLPFPADWSRYGRRAGPIRNQEMIDEGRPTHGWAFHDNLLRSKGTNDMRRRCAHHGIPVRLYSHHNPLGVDL